MELMRNNICSAFLETVANHPDAIALRSQKGNEWQTLTWSDLAAKVARFAGGLQELGIKRGDRVALLIGNRPDFYVADLAVLFSHATPISIYLSSSADQIADLCHRSNAKLLIDETMATTIDGAPINLASAGDKVEPSDRATVIYTSGTTSKPKGVILTHANVMAMVSGTLANTGIDFTGKRVVSYLPLAHIAERALSYYLPVCTAMTVTTCPDAGKIGRYLTATRPHVFFGVPRVWEKLHSATVRSLAKKPLLNKVVNTLLATGALGRFAARPATRMMREKLGLDQVVLAASGAAPLSPEIGQFFKSIGVPFSEIYGMSETCGPLAWSPFDHKLATVGRAMPGTEIRLLPDGEIVVRGDTVFAGYLDDAQATSAAFQGEWLCTGDIGEIDAAGRFKIIDRKKDLIITSGGKNISPAALESALEAHPAIAHACVIGDRRPYVSALITVDPEFSMDVSAVAAIDAHVARVNSSLSKLERVKRHTVVADTWSANSELLTPTMKVKRRGVEARYGAAIDAMYAPGVVSSAVDKHLSSDQPACAPKPVSL